jgi:beta-lactamase class A
MRGRVTEARDLQAEVDRAVGNCPGVAWSVQVRHQGEVVVDVDSARECPSASMGKVIVLWAAAQAIVWAERDADEPVEVQRDDLVADSGIWQHLTERTLSWQSACVLMGAVSDNTAANVLIRELGLERLARVSADLGVPATRQADVLRDHRGPEHPVAPSWSRAQDLADLMDRLARADDDAPVEALVRGWLALDTDLSMVASGFDVDPLAHDRLRGGRFLVHKTGTDAGIRADAGAVGRPGERWSYGVLATWDPQDESRVPGVLAAMRDVGRAIARRCPLSDPLPSVEA